MEKLICRAYRKLVLIFLTATEFDSLRFFDRFMRADRKIAFFFFVLFQKQIFYKRIRQLDTARYVDIYGKWKLQPCVKSSFVSMILGKSVVKTRKCVFLM